LSESRFTELLDISWSMLDGINDCQGPDRAEKYWKMIVIVNYWLVETKLKNINSPILNLETLKYSCKLVFDSNNRSPLLERFVINQSGSSVAAIPLLILYNLMCNVVCSSPEMITSEVKSLFMQFVKRDAPNGKNVLLSFLT